MIAAKQVYAQKIRKNAVVVVMQTAKKKFVKKINAAKKEFVIKLIVVKVV